jgi:two-component SAPR family response regulator
MPTFEYMPEINRIEYDGTDEIILTKQSAALTLNKLEDCNVNMEFKNIHIQGKHGLTFTRKVKLFWKLWKFMK